jgi:heterodisulfide reductase subunit A2
VEEIRIGVFVCHCGTNIAGHLDVKDVAEYAATLTNVVYTKDNLYTCSEAGIAEIKNAVKEQQLNRVVVASCSPRTHQPLFQSACAEAGLNPYLFEMVNIRDQCSWVHMQERPNATAKAKDLIRMGVAKATFLEPQQDIEGSITRRALVIGGGVAGLSAAEAFADMGFQTVVVEREAKLGGMLQKLNLIGPFQYKAADQIEALIKKVTGKKKIKVYLSAEVTGFAGYIGNYDVTVRKKDRKEIVENVGCVVVATGAVPLKPEGMYGFDGSRVITQLQLEEQLRQGDVPARNVVIIQCVGARCAEREYCSRICCLTGVKNAMIIKERNPEAHVTILYRDMQMYGAEKEQMLWDARGLEVRFDVYDPQQPPEVTEAAVRYYQPLTGNTRELAADLVVLSTPLVARESTAALAQMMRLPMDANGFLLEAHAKLRPLDFATDGIFLAGSARYPATVTEACSQGLGAASRAATVLFKDKLVTSAIVAEINELTCVGCQGCLEMCPFGAITYLPEKQICQVNRILCKGCGNCAATCPSQSAQLKGFKPKQLLSQIRAVAF